MSSNQSTWYTFLPAIASCALGALVVAGPMLPAADTAADLADQWVAEKGWNEGWDARNQRLVVVRTGSIPVPPSSPAFVDARAKAFEEAMAGARQAASEFLAAEIGTKMRAQSGLVRVIGDSELAEAMTGAAEDEAFLASSSFEDAVNVTARAALVGLAPMNTFISTTPEGGEVAVVAAWGPRYAAAARGEVRARRGGDSSLGDWFDSLDDVTLLSTWGIRFVRDQEGVLKPVAFGVARRRAGLENEAEAEAAAHAEGGLSRLIGEQVASRKASASASAFVKGTAVPESFSSYREFQSLVESSSDVSIPGLQRVGRRRIEACELTGHSVVVVAYSMMVPANLDEALAGAPAEGGGCPPVEDRMLDYIRSVRVRGLGADEAEAITVALLEAVRREGVRVEGDSRLSKRFSEAMETVDGEIQEKISASTESSSDTKTFANGFIHSYEVIDRDGSAGRIEVTLCANLVRFDPSDPRFGLPPTLAVLPLAIGPDGAEIDGRRVNPRSYADDAEEALDKTLVRSGRFQVLDERNEPDLQRYRDQIVRKAERGLVDEMEMIKIGKALTADYVLTGELDDFKVVDKDAANPASKNVQVTIDARLVNVADGRMVWTDSARVILKGRDLAMARAGRGITDNIERNMEPGDLGVFRATNKLLESLQAFIETMPTPGADKQEAEPAAPTVPVVLRVSLGQVTVESAPGMSVGGRFAVENPVEITLSNGRVLEDVDRVAIVEITQVRSGVAKAKVVEGDADIIEAGVSRLVPIN